MERFGSATNDKQQEAHRLSNKILQEKNRLLCIARSKQWKADRYEEVKLTEQYKETRRRLNKKYYEQRKMKSQQLSSLA